MDSFHSNELNIPIIDKLFTLYKKTHQLIKSFPKTEKYSLGLKAESLILDIFTEVFTANQLPDLLKEDRLQKINSENETLKLLYRLAFEIKIIEVKDYLAVQEILRETGKMLGGWIKYLKAKR